MKKIYVVYKTYYYGSPFPVFEPVVSCELLLNEESCLKEFRKCVRKMKVMTCNTKVQMCRFTLRENEYKILEDASELRKLTARHPEIYADVNHKLYYNAQMSIYKIYEMLYNKHDKYKGKVLKIKEMKYEK
jgi:hypothetical protein